MTQEIATVENSDVQLTAQAPAEMQAAQAGLMAWCDRKIASLREEQRELRAAHGTAVKYKWASTALKNQISRYDRRIVFYGKMKQALKLGYFIVPNFPVTMFAIRTERKEPVKALSTWSGDNREQRGQSLAAGEGEYQNPFPVQYERETDRKDSGGKFIKEYWSERYAEMEFPVTMAKPNIIEAVSRAMAHKLFDELGICPPATVRTDPIIVARLIDPRSTRYNRRAISFLVAWHLDTSTL